MGVFKNLFRYRRTSVSVLTVVLYLSAFCYFYTFNEGVPEINYNNEDIYLLDTAWLHLQEITKHPHPYCSKKNDVVHDYLHTEIKKLVYNGTPDSADSDSKSGHGKKSVHDYVDISDDQSDLHLKDIFKQQDVFNAQSTATRVVYYESSNILVKVQGKLGDSVPGLLLSAHFDSVPLGNGATDDGKGTVTLFAMLQYYIDNQPERTIVFNFNNNEEFGLLGATIFKKHPWLKLVDSVINLEGTGTGGSKAVLFRTSDTEMSKMYRDAVKEQPFGNSMYQQGFYNRFIGSETDYKVYQEQQGLRGWDIAFTKPRDLYHTWKDSTKYTDKQSLYHMLHTAFQLSNYVVNDYNPTDSDSDLSPAVYFDFAGKFYAFSAKTLFEINIISLVCFPILTLITLLIVDHTETRQVNDYKSFKNIWGWCKLPISLIISYSVLFGWCKFLKDHNPMIVSRNYWFPLLSCLSIFLSSQYIILRGVLKANQKFKTICTLEINVALWFFLVTATIGLKKRDYKDTGIYGFTAIYVLFSIGSVVGILFDPHATSFNDSHELETEQNAPLLAGSVNYGSIANESSRFDAEEGENDVPAEQQEQPVETLSDSNEEEDDDHGSIKSWKNKAKNQSPACYGWWIQYLIIVPGTLYTMLNCGGLVIDVLNQTVQESVKSTNTLYRFIPYTAIFMSLPLLPFITKLNYVVVLLINFIFVISAILSVFSTPFTESIPLKFKTQEVWDLNVSPPLGQVIVSGRDVGHDFLQGVISDLPSQKTSGKKTSLDCSTNTGSITCKYDTIPSFRGNTTSNSLSSSTKSPYDFNINVLENNRLDPKRSVYEPISSEFKLEVLENRACTLNFPFNSNTLREIYVYGDDSEDTPYHYIKPDKGIDELQLHKLNFTSTNYHIKLVWLPRILLGNSSDDQDELEVNVTCYWGDYMTYDDDHNVIYVNSPGLEELINYSPKNVIYTNAAKGMISSIKKVVF